MPPNGHHPIHIHNGRTVEQPVHRQHLQCPLSLSKYKCRIFSSRSTLCPTILHRLAATATAAAAATTSAAAAVPTADAGTLPVNEFPIARPFSSGPATARRPGQPPRHRLPTIAIARSIYRLSNAAAASIRKLRLSTTASTTNRLWWLSPAAATTTTTPTAHPIRSLRKHGSTLLARQCHHLDGPHNQRCGRVTATRRTTSTSVHSNAQSRTRSVGPAHMEASAKCVRSAQDRVGDTQACRRVASSHPGRNRRRPFQRFRQRRLFRRSSWVWSVRCVWRWWGIPNATGARDRSIELGTGLPPLFCPLLPLCLISLCVRSFSLQLIKEASTNIGAFFSLVRDWKHTILRFLVGLDIVAAAALQMSEVFVGYRHSGDIASKRRVRESCNAALTGLPEYPPPTL